MVDDRPLSELTEPELTALLEQIIDALAIASTNDSDNPVISLYHSQIRAIKEAIEKIHDKQQPTTK